uniref:NAD-dependent epimerase/dehydratase domain-containing protein n=2 Tax=Salix viminalis TaxID=40686 RepID=A0A6N2N757_SALVM
MMIPFSLRANTGDLFNLYNGVPTLFRALNNAVMPVNVAEWHKYILLLDLTIKGTVNVLKVAKENGVRGFVVMSLSSYIMPSPNWLCDMIKNEVTLKTPAKKFAWEFSKDKGLDVVAVVNPGTTMGPVFMLNGSVVVMLVRLPKDNSNASFRSKGVFLVTRREIGDSLEEFFRLEWPYGPLLQSHDCNLWRNNLLASIMPDNIDELLGQQDLGNDFDMYIGPEMSVASVASPNPFNILAAGIGNSQPSFSLPHEQPNPPQPIFNVATNLHNLGPTTAFEPSGITRYCADDIIGEIRSEFAIKCWESVRNKIARTPIHYIPDLAGEVEKILLSIEDIKVDCSSIRRMVTEVIEDAKKFIHLESSLSPMMTSEQRALDVEKLEVQLKNSEAFEEEASTSISITHAEITKITGQLMELQSKKTELESSLKACDEKLSERKISPLAFEQKSPHYPLPL